MFLKSLTLKGFKSFADSTVLEMEPGVTVVVGPNGSGKSNVVDAIAWVLGAQAPSSVRSQKMEDVIFSGTNKRAALGRAEVTLTLDNSAGLLPLDFSEISVSRTLFRNGDSEYSINGVECRLLDVQELLSDAGVGRQQHVIISQGQIDAVLTARAEDRRAIIEEAAGILKYRKRKEKAERRLEATEVNLLRVQDLIREVRRQLRPLERQAEAARRHGEIVGELRALRLFLSGREVASLRARLTALAGEKLAGDSGEKEIRQKLAALDTEVLAAEADLSARGESGVNDELMRVEQLRERARGLAAVLAERRRSMERDQGQLIADDVVAALEADAAQMREELIDVERSLAIAMQENDSLQVEEETFERERTEQGLFHMVQSNEASNAAAEVRGELRTLRNTVEQGAGEAQKMQARTEQLVAHDADVAVGIEGLQSELADAETEVGSLRAQLVDVTETREQIELLGDEAQVARASAERRSARASAKLEALEEAVASSRARIGAEHLANVSGVVGALVDLLDVDAGWDAAVKASLGEALAAIVVSDSSSARRAIEALQAVDHNGAVLALGISQNASTSLPSGVQSVRSHVRPASGAPAALAALLDSLLSHIGCADDLDAAMAVVENSSSATVVTRRGDRLSPSGWRLGAADDLGSQEVIDRTRIEVESAVADLARLASEVEAAKTRLVAARQEGTQLQSQIDRQLVVVESASDKLTTAINDRRANAAEQQITRDATNETRARLTQYQQRVLELEAILPGLEESEAAEVAAARAQTEERATIDAKSAHLVLRRKDLDVRVAGLREREQFLKQRASDTERRLEVDSAARLEAGTRRQKIEAALVAVGLLSDLVETHRASTEARLAELHEMRRRQSDEVRAVATRLDNARRGRHEAERQLEELRERVRRVDVEEAEARMRLEAAVEMIRRDLEVEPEAAEAAPMPEVIEGVTHADRARVLERDIRLMGPINPLALQEFTELQERHQFLEEQLNDVRSSRRELAQIIAAVDVEIQSVFAEAFADVSVNFTNLFALLFPGGKGKLVLTNPDDMLNTGIEVEAQPPGKTFKKLSLLSGGERSLTALAYLFAVFRSRPSPFYVMDEVEAALDDVNLHRFLGLVSEFRRDAQLIIVSHQKRTMEAADCLMGVSMQPGGSSKVITERSTDALTR
ncbi:MAG: chromosome segregation protein SMC [Actinomycetota bacterium]